MPSPREEANLRTPPGSSACRSGRSRVFSTGEPHGNAKLLAARSLGRRGQEQRSQALQRRPTPPRRLRGHTEWLGSRTRRGQPRPHSRAQASLPRRDHNPLPPPPHWNQLPRPAQPLRGPHRARAPSSGRHLAMPRQAGRELGPRRARSGRLSSPTTSPRPAEAAPRGRSPARSRPPLRPGSAGRPACPPPGRRWLTSFPGRQAGNGCRSREVPRRREALMLRLRCSRRLRGSPHPFQAAPPPACAAHPKHCPCPELPTRAAGEALPGQPRPPAATCPRAGSGSHWGPPRRHPRRPRRKSQSPASQKAPGPARAPQPGKTFRLGKETRERGATAVPAGRGAAGLSSPPHEYLNAQLSAVKPDGTRRA